MMGKIIACSLSWADMPGFFNLFGLLVSACSRRKGCIAGSGAKADWQIWQDLVIIWGVTNRLIPVHARDSLSLAAPCLIGGVCHIPHRNP